MKPPKRLDKRIDDRTTVSADGSLELSREEQNLQVQIAMAYAADGDPWGMLAHFERANLLTGLKLTFRRKWPSIPDEDIDDMIGSGVDALYRKVSTGERVENPIGYVLRVMNNEAFDFTEERKKIVPLDLNRDAHHWADDAPDRHNDARFTNALALAKSLVPRLGEDNLQAVMGLILDAVEHGRSEISTQEIAAVTGLTEVSVRQCRSRGFRRLEKIVRDEGLAVSIDTNVGANDAGDEPGAAWSVQ